MMDNIQFLLNKLAEEASELAQIALKTAQFGLEEIYERDTNAERIMQEYNDLRAIMFLLERATSEHIYHRAKLFDITNKTLIDSKIEKVNKYKEYSQKLGKVE